MNMVSGSSQLKNFLGMLQPIQPSTPLYQIGKFQENFHLVQEQSLSLNFFCPGCTILANEAFYILNMGMILVSPAFYILNMGNNPAQLSI